MTQQEPGTIVDLVFPLAWKTLARDHAQALQHALCAQFPWLGDEPCAAVHPIRLVPGSQGTAMLSRRTRLVLRVSVSRAQQLLTLPGVALQVGEHALQLGSPHVRELLPHATLYAHKVAASSPDELTLMVELGCELAGLAIGGERVCGKHQRMRANGQEMNVFSLMLHGLPPDQSLRLQLHGLGGHRLLGCGVFVPHKSAAAV